MPFRPPERLDETHNLDNFRCRHESLSAFLREKGLKNQEDGAGNCFVVCSGEADGKNVVAFYTLAMGSVSHSVTNAKIRRNMPDPIPVALIGRLAVCEGYERQGLGSGLLKDATARSLAAADQGPGVRALLCHAIDDEAKAFYLRNGFVQSPMEPLTVMLNLADLARRLRQQVQDRPPQA